MGRLVQLLVLLELLHEHVRVEAQNVDGDKLAVDVTVAVVEADLVIA